MNRVAVAVIGLLACRSPHPDPTPRASPPILGALPKPAPINTAKFAGVIVCARCHAAGDHAMRDDHGRDVSPVAQLGASMMGLAARDPYFLAAVRRELIANPGAAPAIQTTCMRCHAPVGFAEDPSLDLAALVAGTSPAAHLGREGIACAGCHALEPDGLGTAPTFTGKAALRTDRVSYGALPEPLGETMIAMSNTRPVPAPHMSQSRLCASCHMVLVHALDRLGAPIGSQVPEQTTYLEWRNSVFQDETPGDMRATPCQGCHLAAQPTAMAFSTRPPDAPARPGYRHHAIVGGNAYLLEQLAGHTDWLAAATTGPELVAASAHTREFLAGAAKLAIERDGEAIRIDVVNLTGHKLPTGYPSRRMWLHVTAVDRAGAVVFESGAHAAGAIVGRSGQRLDRAGVILPHRDRLAADDEVAIWEAVPVDAAGARTHLLLGATRFAKDDRILPAGWRGDHPDGVQTRPIGTAEDTNFRAGKDSVTVALPPGAARVDVELLFQAIPPETIESYRPDDSPEAARFRAITSRAPIPDVIARVTAELR